MAQTEHAVERCSPGLPVLGRHLLARLPGKQPLNLLRQLAVQRFQPLVGSRLELRLQHRHLLLQLLPPLAGPGELGAQGGVAGLKVGLPAASVGGQLLQVQDPGGGLY